MIRSIEEAGEWLEGLINVEKRPDWPYSRMGLAPVRALLARLESPHRDLACLHVAGSKGKGSTALLAEAFRIAQTSWKGKSGTALAHDERRARFYRSFAASACAVGTLRVCFLRIGERAAAMQLAVESGGSFWLLKVGRI